MGARVQRIVTWIPPPNSLHAVASVWIVCSASVRVVQMVGQLASSPSQIHKQSTKHDSETKAKQATREPKH
eukprot:4291123-Amphidinium_carterae.1